jgi:hypothetical protein
LTEVSVVKNRMKKVCIYLYKRKENYDNVGHKAQNEKYNEILKKDEHVISSIFFIQSDHEFIVNIFFSHNLSHLLLLIDFFFVFLFYA